jgi:cystathionine beta-lyase/cystathionine gamma-synthase
MNWNADIKERRMLRMYLGLEEPGYLINDLEQAFDSMI